MDNEILLDILYICMFYFGRVFIELEFKSYLVKGIFRIIGSIIMTIGCFGWITPTNDLSLVVAILLTLFVGFIVGWLISITKDYSDKLGLMAMVVVLIGAIFNSNPIYFGVFTILFVVAATIYEYKKEKDEQK